MKKALALLLATSVFLPVVACRPAEVTVTSESSEEPYELKYQKYAAMTPEEIVSDGIDPSI